MIHPGLPGFPNVRSPDGSVEVAFCVEEMRMSLFVQEPVVYRVRDERVVLDLCGTRLDAHGDITFPGPGQVRLVLRRYPRGDRVRYDLVVDVERETFRIGEEPEHPLNRIGSAIPGASGG